jgi:hypothetical protein
MARPEPWPRRGLLVRARGLPPGLLVVAPRAALESADALGIEVAPRRRNRRDSSDLRTLGSTTGSSAPTNRRRDALTCRNSGAGWTRTSDRRIMSLILGDPRTRRNSRTSALTSAFAYSQPPDVSQRFATFRVPSRDTCGTPPGGRALPKMCPVCDVRRGLAGTACDPRLDPNRDVAHQRATSTPPTIQSAVRATSALCSRT